jgi:hypothetical protein|tara:strand:- start:262 stop:468 length:207 start_codon:yes stop_codon:yes gene_type:complete
LPYSHPQPDLKIPDGVQQHIDDGRLVVFEQANSEPLLNDIYISSLKSDQRPYRVELVISWFMNMVADH